MSRAKRMTKRIARAERISRGEATFEAVDRKGKTSPSETDNKKIVDNKAGRKKTVTGKNIRDTPCQRTVARGNVYAAGNRNIGLGLKVRWSCRMWIERAQCSL